MENKLKEPVKRFFESYIGNYFHSNEAAQKYKEFLIDKLKVHEIDILQYIDHCTVRTNDVASRARGLSSLGFKLILESRINMKSWWLEGYRCGFDGFPVLVLDQPSGDFKEHESNSGRIIADYAKTHGEGHFHHIAFRVNSLTEEINILKEHIPFAMKSLSVDEKSGLKQIFTVPEKKDGKNYTVLELIERPLGCKWLAVRNADNLAQSTF